MDQPQPTTSPATPEQPSLSPEEIEALQAAGRSWSRFPRADARDASGVAVDPDLDVVESRGSHPGQRYVRVLRSRRQGFERIAPGWLQATPRLDEPATAFGRFRHRMRARVIGAPMATHQMVHERLTKIKALAVLSSDALSSVAYATEQIIMVLVTAGVVALSAEIWIMAAIAFLLFAVTLSYRQTIKAYPKGGGSYIVAKDNLGPLPGLIAASALMTDYVLTVAVSVASGYDQLEGYFPQITPYATAACVSIVILIMLANLRGLREAGSIFAAPTYIFIFSILLMVGTLFVRLATGTLHAQPYPQAMPVIDNLSLFLVLKAFSSGCSAMTGVEAISDGVMAFKAPEWRNARVTLTVMGSLLAVMFVGITVSANLLHITVFDTTNPGYLPTVHGHAVNLLSGYQYNAVISQLAQLAFGNGSLLSFIVIGATCAILILAANTSFSDFPRLFYFLARDDFAPHQFGRLGDRLAYSNGIIVLTILSCSLLVIFQANVNALIPLYAIGVFIAFTMSQAGMVKRWLTRREDGWKRSLPLNAIGMVLTACVFIVTAIAKFQSGAWIVLVLIPALVSIFYSIHRHYAEVESSLQAETPTSPDRIHPVCLVPITDLNSVALQSLALARSISPNVIAIHVCDNDQHIGTLRSRWEVWGNHVPLEILESPFRTFVRPLLRYIDAIDKQRQGDTLIVVLPELVPTRKWQQILHNQSALRLKAALLFRPGTVVVNVPYHLRRPRPVPHLPKGEDPEAL